MLRGDPNAHRLTLAIRPSCEPWGVRRPKCVIWNRAKRLLIRLLQKPFHKPIGAATVGEGKMPRQVARRRGKIEALVLLIAAGERGAGEIPGKAKDPDALLGRHALGARQIAVDQRPQV